MTLKILGKLRRASFTVGINQILPFILGSKDFGTVDIPINIFALGKLKLLIWFFAVWDVFCKTYNFH
jgi:hypothetical protein